jgi:hypothetical protein
MLSGTIYGNIHFPYGLTVTTLSGTAQAGITSGGIITGTLGSGLVRSGAISSGSIGINALAAGAWSASQFLGQDGAGNLDWITPTATVASGGITSGMIGIGAVNNVNIVSGTIANDKLTNSTVTIAGSSTALGGSWAAAALTTASGLATGTYYPSGALTIGIATAGVVNAMIASGAVTSGNIASGSIGNNHIASGAVTSGDIGQFAVANINIISGTVANDKLTNSTVTIAGSSTALGGSWAAAALTTASGLATGTYYPSGALTIGIATNGVVTAMIASGAVGSNQIASGAVGELQMSNTVANKTIIGDIQTINAQTAAYTLASGDAGKLITVNVGAPAIVTIPTNASVPFAVGSHIDFIQLGAGQVTISGNIGVTINYSPGNKLRAQYAGASVIKIATDTWCLVGDIST